jgi:hypothetical protein
MPARSRLIPLFYFIGLVPFTAYVFGLWGRVEIRDRGVLTSRGLLRWPRIESYGWDPPVGAFALLRLRVRSLLPPFATRRIYLPADRQFEAETVISKQLADWPGATISESESKTLMARGPSQRPPRSR